MKKTDDRDARLERLLSRYPMHIRQAVRLLGAIISRTRASELDKDGNRSLNITVSNKEREHED